MPMAYTSEAGVSGFSRIAVVCKGRIMDVISAGEENRERIGLLMTGIEDDQCRLA